MLASPVRPPPPLASIHEGAMRIDAGGAPNLSRFQARDGTWLAYRLYPAASGARDRIAILAHGSSASSIEMHRIATALAPSRRHGGRGRLPRPRRLGDARRRRLSRPARRRSRRSRRRTAQSRLRPPDSRSSAIRRAAGSRCASRASPLGDAFDRFVLLAPYLGYSAPTNRPAEGPGSLGFARPAAHRRDVMLERIGIDWPQSLPAIAFANAPEAENGRDQPILLPPAAELHRAARLGGRLPRAKGPHRGHRRAPTTN